MVFSCSMPLFGRHFMSWLDTMPSIKILQKYPHRDTLTYHQHLKCLFRIKFSDRITLQTDQECRIEIFLCEPSSPVVFNMLHVWEAALVGHWCRWQTHDKINECQGIVNLILLSGLVNLRPQVSMPTRFQLWLVPESKHKLSLICWSNFDVSCMARLRIKIQSDEIPFFTIIK